MKRKKTAFFLFCLIAIAVAAGCKRKIEKTEETPVRKPGIEKEYKRGPITFVIKASREEITIADHLSLTLEVRAKEEYDVLLPEFGEKLEQFAILDYRSPSPKLIEDGLTLHSKSYELEPFLSGAYTIPPMKVTFWKKGEEEEKKHSVESEPITITVKSLLPEKAAELTIEEIVPPMELPRSIPWLIYLIAAVLLIVVIVFVVLMYRRKRKERIDSDNGLLPHEKAFEELEKLIADNLIDQGELKLFYLRLSNILRHYIEDRFALRAPERTTEEFLVDLKLTRLLIPSHKELLMKFLQHCDMVKFAEHTPVGEEIQKAFDGCKQFIVETEVREEG